MARILETILKPNLKEKCLENVLHIYYLLSLILSLNTLPVFFPDLFAQSATFSNIAERRNVTSASIALVSPMLLF